MRVCSIHGCPNIYPASEGSRCSDHRKEADKARGTATERGYNSRGHQAFRRAVITRDPICVRCQLRPSTVADHHPISRRDLQARGQNPNDPQFGRGLCSACHNKETATHQPGGWNTGA